jgi:hypothetical protein
MRTGARSLGWRPKMRGDHAQQDIMLAHENTGGSIAGRKNLFKKMDRPGRVRTRQAMDPNSLMTQYARTDMRKFSFGVRVVDSYNRLEQDTRSCAGKGKVKVKINGKTQNTKVGQQIWMSSKQWTKL